MKYDKRHFTESTVIFRNSDSIKILDAQQKKAESDVRLFGAEKDDLQQEWESVR